MLRALRGGKEEIWAEACAMLHSLPHLRNLHIVLEDKGTDQRQDQKKLLEPLAGLSIPGSFVVEVDWPEQEWETYLEFQIVRVSSKYKFPAPVPPWRIVERYAYRPHIEFVTRDGYGSWGTKVVIKFHTRRWELGSRKMQCRRS